MKINRKELERQYINDLKSENATGPRVEINKEHGYKIRILHRGDRLFYQEGDRAMICDLDIDGCAIPVKSIKKRDDGTKITEEERDRIKERIRLYFLKFQDGSHVTFF